MKTYQSKSISKKTFILTFLLITVFSLTIFSQTDEKIEQLDKYFEEAIKEWNVPGMAVAIVKKNEVILSKGYGVRTINVNKKIDKNTLFPIASITKSFTSAAIASLVDEGKLSWDDPVRKYLPYFKLYDPYVSENMKVRDLLCHRSGLKTFSGDLLWYGSSYSREEVLRRARFLKPEYGFREHFGYSNIMYIAAGEVVEMVSGKSWDEYINEKFFEPLGMAKSNTSLTELKKYKNIARPHTEKDGKVIEIPYLNWDNVGGAGAINSNVNEMAQWIKLQLNNGSLDGKKYFSRKSSEEMWSAHTVQAVSRSILWPSNHFKAYGLGWGLFDYHGKKIVGHSGGYDGIISYIALVPEEDLGFIILTNKNSALYYAMFYKILDVFIGDIDKDWSKIIHEIVMSRDEANKEKKNSEILKETKPILDLKEYTGIYGGKLYGNSEIFIKDGKLYLKFLPSPKFVGELKHYKYNTFEIEFEYFPSLPKGKVHFLIDENGKTEELRIDVPNPDFDFTELKFLRL
ncbi:MAG: serine hydrolase [Bacteroidota bacterium]|nr:serine hydrolase [Bacteroidota bacterium]